LKIKKSSGKQRFFVHITCTALSELNAKWLCMKLVLFTANKPIFRMLQKKIETKKLICFEFF
jgi:hypothetical protein